MSNREEGSVSPIDMTTRQVSTKWTIPGGDSPNMGGVSADGKVLWLSGRVSLGHTGNMRSVGRSRGNRLPDRSQA